MAVVAVSTRFLTPFSPSLSSTQFLPLSPRTRRNLGKGKRKLFHIVAVTSNPSGSLHQTVGEQLLPKSEEKKRSKKRVFFLDVNPLCYEGSKPSLQYFGHWISLFFNQVSRSDPVVAVFDGEKGYECRQQLLPSYKAHRRKFQRQLPAPKKFLRGNPGASYEVVTDFLRQCNVPVVKVKGYEADDVVATLTEQVLGKGFRAVIASPDKDFKQLISEDVQIVMPIPELDRWSYYTLKHYVAQYNCNPCSDLSLRCIMGDEVDGVPGIQHKVPGFGRKTAVKLLQKHGSLENLLSAAAVRTVGKQYVQNALTNYAAFLRRNYEVLALRRIKSVTRLNRKSRNYGSEATALASAVATCSSCGLVFPVERLGLRDTNLNTF